MDVIAAFARHLKDHLPCKSLVWPPAAIIARQPALSLACEPIS
jgi:hypothetical protein